jgi:hypothetical protein
MILIAAPLYISANSVNSVNLDFTKLEASIPHFFLAEQTIFLSNLKARSLLGIVHAIKTHTFNQHRRSFFTAMKPLNAESKSPASQSRVTLETIISVGVVGWLAIGIVLMGLGIW